MIQPDPGGLGRRLAGVLLHPTSLPGPWRCGNLGPAADRFLDIMGPAGLSVWQTLPLGPPDRYQCPYQARSVLAGNPELISPELLERDGLLDADAAMPSQPRASNATARIVAAANFLAGRSGHLRADYETFAAAQAPWLPDFALFTALQAEQVGAPWYRWPAPLRDRDPAALAAARERLHDAIDACCFEQFVFARQWRRLKTRANAAGIALFGDMPLFVAWDSADAWSQREVLCLNADGTLAAATGVPPDYFSADGQYWGSPPYRWDVLERDHYAWWRDRLRHLGERFDLLRLDHFRGIAAYWSIPGGTRDARRGAWQPGPGAALFDALEGTDRIPFLVAEDLGDITPDVEALRRALGIPGTRVLQFAFDGSPDNPHLPAQLHVGSVAYTGTHDNDTTVGWWQSVDERTRDYVRTVLGGLPDPMPWPLIDAALASPAFLAVIPLQDWLGLDSAGRMNTPGRAAGNWRWRLDAPLPASLAENIRAHLERARRLDAWPRLAAAGDHAS